MGAQGSSGGGTGGKTSTDTITAGHDVFQDIYADVQILTKIFGHPSGSGRMAARGLAQEAAKIGAFQARQALLQAKLQQAQTEFAQTNPFEPGQVVAAVENAPPHLVKQVARRREKLERLATVKQTGAVIKKSQKIQAKLARLENREAPFTDIRIAELTGANAGYWRERGAPPPLWLTQRSH